VPFNTVFKIKIEYTLICTYSYIACFPGTGNRAGEIGNTTKILLVAVVRFKRTTSLLGMLCFSQHITEIALL
jgi:hypothetical protein